MRQKSFLTITKSLVTRQMKDRYGGSVLGVIWLFLYPLMFVAVTSLVFSYVFSDVIEGVPYALVVMVGFIHWWFFSQSVSQMTKSLVLHRDIIRNNKLPLLAIPLSTMVTRLPDLIIGLVLVFVYSLVIGFPIISVYLLLYPVVIAAQLFFQLGLGLILSIANAHYRDVQFAVDIGLHILFYATPVLYLARSIPAKAQLLLAFNPLQYFFSSYHQVFLLETMPVGWSFIMLAVISTISVFIGYFVFNHNKYEIPEKL